MSQGSWSIPPTVLENTQHLGGGLVVVHTDLKAQPHKLLVQISCVHVGAVPKGQK